MAADRTVVVRLMAMTSQFTSGMSRAGMSVGEVTAAMKAAEAQAGKMGASIVGANTRAAASARTAGSAFRGAIATGVVVGLGMAIKSTADFDQAMSKVGAVADATAGQMQQLRDAALDMGPAFGFSAREAAGAQEELAKAGLKVSEILGGGLKASLALAAAGDMSLADAAKVASVAMNQFHLQAKDLPHVADLLSRGANKALGDVSDLGVAFRYVGPEAHALGVSVDETVGVLAMLAQNGIQADLAGTGLRGTLMQLASATPKAREEMRRLGIDLWDTGGNFIGFIGMAEQLHKALDGLKPEEKTKALGVMFGNAQVPVATILATGGGDVAKQWVKDVQTGAGATDVAAKKLDNLTGDVKKLGGALQANAIRYLEPTTKLLRGATQGATDLAGGFGDLSRGTQSAALALAGMLIFGRRVGATFGTAGGEMRKFASNYDTARQAQLASVTATRQLNAALKTVVPPATMANLRQVATQTREMAHWIGRPGTSAIGGTGDAYAVARANEQARAALGRLTAAQRSQVHPEVLSRMRALATETATAAAQYNGFADRMGRASAIISTTTGRSAQLGVAMRTLGTEARLAGSGLMGALGGPWGLAIMGGVTLLGVLSEAHAKSAAKAKADADATIAFAEALHAANGQITSSLRDSAAGDALKTGLLKTAQEAGIPLTRVTEAVLGNAQAYKEAKEGLKQYMFELMLKDLSPQEWEKQSGAVTKSLTELDRLFGIAKAGTSDSQLLAAATKKQNEGHKDTSKTAKTAATSLLELAMDTGKAGDAADDATPKVADFGKAWETLFGAMLGAHRASTTAAGQLGAISRTVAENGRSFSLTTKAGRENRAMMDDLIETSGKLGDAAVKDALRQGKSNEVALEAGRKATMGFLEQVRTRFRRAGILTKENEAWIRSFMQVPAVTDKPAETKIAPHLDMPSANAVEQWLLRATKDRPVMLRPFIGPVAAPLARPTALTRNAGTPGGPWSSLDKSRWGHTYSYAGGGVAKIAPPGTLYQWAEPETGGEAFVPRKGNPARSKEILDTAAGWYGFRLTKMAAGGISAPLGDFLGRWDTGVQTQQGLNAAAAQRAQDRKANLQGLDDAKFARLSALRDVTKAEEALRIVLADTEATAQEKADAEWNLTTARRGLAGATRDLGAAQAKLKTTAVPVQATGFTRFAKATALGVKNTNAFLWALKKLADRGFGQLAQQLLAMGGPEAEKIAQGALRASDAALRGTAANVATAVSQQKTIENYPAMLAIRSALRSGTSYGSLVGSGQVDAASLNAALTLMHAELSKTAAGKAMLAAMGGANAAALQADMRRFASGGIAAEGTQYRFAEQGTGGEAVIPRFGSGGPAVLRKAAAWHGMTLAEGKPWDNVMQRAGGSSVQITVRGEGVLSGMIEATVDGKLVQVARAVRHGSR